MRIIMSNLRNIRNEKGLRLVDAARELGTNPGNLSRIESGTQYPKVDLARRIAALYGMTLDEVFYRQTSAQETDVFDRAGAGEEPLARVA